MGAAGGGTWGRGSGNQVPQEGRMGRSHRRGRGWGPAWGSQPGVESQRGQGPWEGSAGEAPLGTHRDQSGLLPSALWRQPHGAQGHHPVPRLPRAVPQQPQLRVEDHGPRRRWHPGEGQGGAGGRHSSLSLPLRPGVWGRPTNRKTQQVPAQEGQGVGAGSAIREARRRRWARSWSVKAGEES